MAKKNQSEINDAELMRVIIHEAADVATLLTKHIHNRPQIHLYGMTVIGYAVEMLLNTAAQANNDNHDRMSREWLKFMEQAHEDIKRISQNMNTQGS